MLFRAFLCSCLLWGVQAAPKRALACDEHAGLTRSAERLMSLSAELDSRAVRDALSNEELGMVRVRLHRVAAGADWRSLTPQWLEAFRTRTDGPVRCGRAMTPSGGVVLLAEDAADLSVDSSGHVSWEIRGPFEDPQVLVESNTGHTEYLSPDEEGRWSLPRGHAWARAQLLADSPQGPRPIAEVRLSSHAIPIPVQGNPAERVLTLRRDSGAPTVRDNRLLRRAANAHAAAVCRQNLVAHETGDGDPERRLLRQGVIARVVGEVVARGASLDEAMERLFESPSHRLALNDRRFTDMGVGEAVDAGGNHCIVMVLAAWPRVTSAR